MEQIWNENDGSVMDVFSKKEYDITLLYKHGKVYFEMLKHKETGKLDSGWFPESDFESLASSKNRDDYIEITEDTIFKLLTNK